MSSAEAKVVLRISEDPTGTIEIDRLVLERASDPLKHALELSLQGGSVELQVDGTLSTWLAVANYLSPASRPAMSLDLAHAMLPLAHKYDVKAILDECSEYLRLQLPAQLSPDPRSPSYIVRWMSLADDLQLDEVSRICSRKFCELDAGKLHLALFASEGSLPPARPHRCQGWCGTCQKWSFSTARYPQGVEGFRQHPGYHTCGHPMTHDAPPLVRWHKAAADLTDDVNAMSRGALAEMLVMAICHLK